MLIDKNFVHLTIHISYTNSYLHNTQTYILSHALTHVHDHVYTCTHIYLFTHSYSHKHTYTFSHTFPSLSHSHSYKIGRAHV